MYELTIDPRHLSQREQVHYATLGLLIPVVDCRNMPVAAESLRAVVSDLFPEREQDRPHRKVLHV